MTPVVVATPVVVVTPVAAVAAVVGLTVAQFSMSGAPAVSLILFSEMTGVSGTTGTTGVFNCK